MPATQPSARSLRRLVAISVAGPSVEWYDFFVYGTAAALVFNTLFFPGSDPIVGSLLAFGTFAVGYLARPLGGVLFGHVGDRYGRKAAFVPSLLLMGIATMLIGLLPTYATVGVAAPIMLTVLRLAQGIAVGGMWAGAGLIATENAPANRRGLFGSFVQVGAPVGLILSTFAFVAATSLFDAHFLGWGWRVPFLLGVVMVGLGFYVRSRLEEPATVKAADETNRSQDRPIRWPIVQVVRAHPGRILLLAGSTIFIASSFNMYAAYMLSYGTVVAGNSRDTMLDATLIAAVAMVPVIVAAGALSDRFSRRAVYGWGAVATALWTVPAFLLVNTGRPALVVVGCVVGLVLLSISVGPQVALCTELFRSQLRYSGASFAYQTASVVGGGLSPVIVTALYVQSRSFIPGALFFVAIALISAICTYALRVHASADTTLESTVVAGPAEATTSGSSNTVQVKEGRE